MSLIRQQRIPESLMLKQQQQASIKKHGVEMYSIYFATKADKLFQSIQDEIQWESLEKSKKSQIFNNKETSNLGQKNQRCQTASTVRKNYSICNQNLKDYFANQSKKQLISEKIKQQQQQAKYLEEIGDLENYLESDEIIKQRPATSSGSLSRRNYNNNTNNTNDSYNGFYKIKRNQIKPNWNDLVCNIDDNFQKEESNIEKLYKDSMGIQQQILTKDQIGVGKRIKQLHGLDNISKQIEKVNQQLLSGNLKI